MVKRLTEQKTTKGITRVVVRSCVCEFQTVLNKLCALEDIMDKYGIESAEELDFRLAFKQNDVFNYKEITKLETDRDTWKRACELACDVILRFTDGCPCKADYFYQQAKKEK